MFRSWRAYWEIKLAVLWAACLIVTMIASQYTEVSEQWDTVSQAVYMGLTMPATIITAAGAIMLGIGLYMLPTLVARSRQHRNVPAILVVNLAFGWTVIGWVGCMAWDLLAQEAPPGK